MENLLKKNCAKVGGIIWLFLGGFTDFFLFGNKRSLSENLSQIFRPREEREIYFVFPKLFDSLERKNFDSLKTKIFTVWKGKFWQFGKGNFDSLKRKFLTVWKGKFWQFENKNFDSLKRKILTVWKGKFWQFEKEIFDSLKRKILTVWGFLAHFCKISEKALLIPPSFFL